METGIHNTSEIGRLRKVLLHRPGQELENLMPEYLERLLFDDIPYLHGAQQEHDRFVQLLRENGTEVVFLEDLTAEAIETDDPVRDAFIDAVISGAGALAERGINTIGVPGTIDLDIACTDYTIGFDTAINTAMEAIDKIRDTSTSHERVSIVEVMGRQAGYIAMWCAIANGAEDMLLPEMYDHDEQALIDRIIEKRRKGKKHHIIINAEGIGHSVSMAARIEAATGIETRATILGHMQRGGTPTCKDRVYASIMGAKAVELLQEGKSKRIVAYRGGAFVDYDIQEALEMKKSFDMELYHIANEISF